MPKSGRKARVKHSETARTEENRKVKLLEQLARFEWFQETIMPALQEDIREGKKAEDLREKYSSLIQAALISTALMDRDAGKRTAAAKDILDRQEGKAKERAEHTHRFEELSEEQLASLLKTRLAELGEDEEDSIQH